MLQRIVRYIKSNPLPRLFGLAILLANITAVKVLAASVSPPEIIVNSTSSSDPKIILATLYDKIFTIVSMIGGGAAVIYMIWSGIQYITAGSSADKAKAARTAIVNTITGVAILVASYAIIRLGIAIGTEIQTIIHG